MNVDLIWTKFLQEIQPKINNMVYTTWFQKTKLSSLKDGKATIIVQMLVQKERLNEAYYELIQSILYDITNTRYELEFVLTEEIKKKKIEQTSFDSIINQSNENIEYKHHSNLIKNLTFDNFIVGNSNRLAHASALSVAENPGKVWNPLFIYGISGIGKTHLLHAIGNYIEEKSNKKVLYVSSEKFTDDCSKLSNKNPEYADYFKKKYRSVDVLIIDDIQFFANRPKTEEEFFHTFNILKDDDKQIVLSSDSSPKDLNNIEERLKTRFTWGLQVDIYAPELELRKNILKKKIQSAQIHQEIPDEVIDYMAANFSDNVRSLEGAINSLMAYSFMMDGKEITLELAVEALKDKINRGTSEVANILRVQKVVADYFQISIDDLKSKKRSANIAFPRQIAMYLSRTELNESFERIGLEFGGKDHSTVMHSCDKIKKEMEENIEIKNSIEKIKENL